MSLIVKDLCKRFKHKIAVDNLSFEIEKGNILGLLGPNGAGKSTTLRMLSGYWEPTSGKIQIDGHDLAKEPIAAKKKIGYLPEHNPLYVDLYVNEYLQLMGKLHGLSSKECKKNLKTVVEACSLGDVKDKKIGILSKGYRQRVGLAQALLHNPPILILDEPTAGLDPNQLQTIRHLIKNLSQEKAILFSTHIIQEVEAVCSQITILSKGKNCLTGLVNELPRLQEGYYIVTFSEPISLAHISLLHGINKVHNIEPCQYRLESVLGQDLYHVLFDFAKQQGATIYRIEQKKESLEELFIALTQPGNTEKQTTAVTADQKIS